MIKKGIILAGGHGTRMSPLTKAINKQLLPIYDKPLIFYPLSVLMLAGIKDILIIVNKGQLAQFKKILPEGKNLGIKINFAQQDFPKGLPEAFKIGEKFIGKDNVALILGDNFFYGQSLTAKLEKSLTHKSGSRIFLKKVKKPENYGVAVINNNKIERLIEKPKKLISSYAITGLYFFDNNVIKYAKTLKPSKRGELEIIDLLQIYKKNYKLSFEHIGRGAVWSDAGKIDDMTNISSFVQSVEKVQDIKIACLEEIALNKKWIDKKKIFKNIKFYGNCDYSNYLKKI